MKADTYLEIRRGLDELKESTRKMSEDTARMRRDNLCTRLKWELTCRGVEATRAGALARQLVDADECAYTSKAGEDVLLVNGREYMLGAGLDAWLGTDAGRRATSSPAPAPAAGGKPKGPLYDGMTYEQLAVKLRDALGGDASITISD